MPARCITIIPAPTTPPPHPTKAFGPNTEKIADLSGAKNAKIEEFHRGPGGRRREPAVHAKRRICRRPRPRLTAPNTKSTCGPARIRRFVYPHRVDANVEALRGTNYLADDPELYNLSDKKTYDDFLRAGQSPRRRESTTSPADMKNPYWAARNILEYIQDNYYYPDTRANVKPATVDYARKHYDANPGNLKIELSNRRVRPIADHRLLGHERDGRRNHAHLGFPARWIGTGTQQGPALWDANKNGLLDADESAPCTNGHRYTHVWLGSHYGWVAFDGTPSNPISGDYDPPAAPPTAVALHESDRRERKRRQADHFQYRLRAASALSTEISSTTRNSPSDNDCGGDQTLQSARTLREARTLEEAPVTGSPSRISASSKMSPSADRRIRPWSAGGSRATGTSIPRPPLTSPCKNSSRESNATGTWRCSRRKFPCQTKTLAADLSPYSGRIIALPCAK